MKKWLIGISLLMFAGVALAQVVPVTCDMSLYQVVEYNGKVMWDGSTNYHGMTVDDVQFTRAQAVNGTVGSMNSLKDHGGPYTLTLGEKTKCSDGTTSGTPFVYTGLRANDLHKSQRALLKAGNDLVGVSEGAISKGKGKGKGREKLFGTDD